MAGSLEGKNALITGSTSGIGKACAKLFAQNGARVVVVGRNYKKAAEVVDEIRSKGGIAEFLFCDVSKTESILGMYEKYIAVHDKLDILVNNAGVLLTGSLEEITENDWNLTYDVNVKAVMETCQLFMALIKKAHGVILNNASINGLHSYIKGKRSYMYATSKAATIQLTKYLAKNYAPDVRVNCLCPGITKTNLFTNKDFSRFKGCNLMDRMAEPEEIAKVALFLCSQDSSFMTGSVVVVDGGETLL